MKGEKIYFRTWRSRKKNSKRRWSAVSGVTELTKNEMRKAHLACINMEIIGDLKSVVMVE